jgi:hypothetical protein
MTIRFSSNSCPPAAKKNLLVSNGPSIATVFPLISGDNHLAGTCLMRSGLGKKLFRMDVPSGIWLWYPAHCVFLTKGRRPLIPIMSRYVLGCTIPSKSQCKATQETGYRRGGDETQEMSSRSQAQRVSELPTNIHHQLLRAVSVAYYIHLLGGLETHTSTVS